MKLIIEKLHAAAFYLTKYPESSAEDVAEFVSTPEQSVSKRTIERWSTRDEWHTALDNFGFTGERNWRRNVHRDVKRDDGDLVELARSMYLKHRSEGKRKGVAVAITARIVNKTEQTIRNWRKRFGWEAEVGNP